MLNDASFPCGGLASWAGDGSDVVTGPAAFPSPAPCPGHRPGAAVMRMALQFRALGLWSRQSRHSSSIT
jgi:hypothetical protein